MPVIWGSIKDVCRDKIIYGKVSELINFVLFINCDIHQYIIAHEFFFSILAKKWEIPAIDSVTFELKKGPYYI